MSNTYFRFKEFTIHQDKCAMKVSTDACIQGAWTPAGDAVKHVLDIGAGTGLLSLMLAQRHPGIRIDAIELDETAVGQAAENIAASPWAGRIKILQGDVKVYGFPRKYDMVICNPPFFQNSLLGPNAARNNVRHNTTLELHELAHILPQLVAPSGYCSVLLPTAEARLFETLMNDEGWAVFNKLLIRPTLQSVPNRVVSLFASKMTGTALEEELQIYDAVNKYTTAFSTLMAPFYLKL